MADVTYIPNPLIDQQWEVAPETHVMIDNLGAEIAQVAQGLAPVDTGALQESIVAHPGAEATATSEIVAEVPYAAFVEFGTSLMPAQPYLRPALDQVVGR